MTWYQGRAEKNSNWNEAPTNKHTGYWRARNWFKHPGPCVECGTPKSERHHIDGNPFNNAPENIKLLCRRCHMKADGRLAGMVTRNKSRKGRKHGMS